MTCRCFICERNNAKIAIAQSHQVLFYLQRILMYLKMDVYRINKIIKNKELCFSYRVKDVAQFLSEGQIYLNVANILREHNQKMSDMFAIMLKAMNIYSRLKVDLKDKIGFERSLSTDEELSNDEEDADGWNVISGIEFEEMLNDELDEEDKIFDISNTCLCCITEVHYREFLLKNVDSLIKRINSLCSTFIGSSSVLYVMLYRTLRDYCKRVRLFLHSDTRIKESRQEKSPRGDCRKCDLLEQLLERVSKEQKYVARFVDIKLKDESGKFYN